MNAQPSLLAEFSRAKLIGREDYGALQRDVETALEILEICIATVRSRPDLLAMAVANHPCADAMLEHIDDEVEAIARFDAFVDTEGTLRFIEFNPGLCGGAFNSYRAAQVFLDSEPGRRLAQTAPLEAAPTPAYFVDALWTACRAHNGRDAATIALVWPGAAPPADAISREMQAFGAQQALRGGQFLMAGGGDVERRGDTLFLGEDRIDVAFVMDWGAMGWAAPALSAPLAGTWMANSVGSTVFRGGKHLFAVMSDPDLGAPLNAAQRVWIERHIPWTRMLPAPADDRPAARALRALALARRESLILKPSIGRGGQGIVAGWAVSADQWRAAVEDPHAPACLIQERVYPIPEAPFDDVAPPGASIFTDLCMFVWNNRNAAGIVSRASQSWLLNVSAGEAKAIPVLVQG